MLEGILTTIALLAFSLILLSSGNETGETCHLGESHHNSEGECIQYTSNGEDDMKHTSTVKEGKLSQSVKSQGTGRVPQYVTDEDAQDEEILPVTASEANMSTTMEETSQAVTAKKAGDIHSIKTLADNSSNTSNFEGEFKCEFHWNEIVKNSLKVKIVNWMQERDKIFHRFIVPVMGYNSDLPSLGSNFTGVLIWVWYQEKQKYMLHFPHNFVSISLQAMGVVTQDWALDYYDKSFTLSSVTLSGNGIDIDDAAYQYKNNLGHCDRECLDANQSCGLGKREMAKLLTELGETAGDFKWEYFCLQLEYKDVHDVAQTGSRPNHLMPDLLYYAMFLKKLLTERLLGLPIKKKQFLQYRCYDKNNITVFKSRELLENYFVIPGFLALLLWLYCPLLLHYFPSSSKEVDQISRDCPEGMFPSHKMPRYFGRCLKILFCFYIEGDSFRIRLRRLVFLVVLFLSSFRLFFLPSYGIYFVCVAVIISLACTYPAHISSYIDTDKVVNSNKRFAVLGWELWPGLIKVNPALKEYQLLAAVMQERVYMFLDSNFWRFLAEMSFSGLSASTGITKCAMLLRGSLLFITGLGIYIFYYFIPIFYFIGVMSSAIFRSSNWRVKPSALLYRLVMFAAFIYSIMVAYFWCCAVIEFSIFTLYGGVLSPSIVVPYFVLVGSTVRTVHLLVHSLHEHYDEILNIVIEKIKSETDFDPAVKMEKKMDENVPSNYTISVTDQQQNKINILRHTVPVMYILRELYDFVVEETSPVRRYVFFIVIQVIAILVYAGLVLSIKNVLHVEKQVSTIFQIISNFAVIFVPGILKFLAYKSHYGKKEKEVMKKNIHFAMMDYFSR